MLNIALNNTIIYQKIINYFYQIISNVTIIPFSFENLIELYPECKPFKLTEDNQKPYVGICNLVLFNLYQLYNNYKSYIFWEDDLVSTFNKFIYDDIDDENDIILMDELYYNESWYWHTIKKRNLGIYDNNKAPHQLYCTYRFSNEVLKNIINIIRKENIYGHHEDIYSCIIDYWNKHKTYNITSVNKILNNKILYSFLYNFLKPQLKIYFDEHNTYKNLLIHPIKTEVELYKILNDKIII